MTMQQTNREILEDFLDLINRQHRVREAFEKHVVEDYIQHNFTLENGREGAINLIEGLVATPGFEAQVKHFVVEGDMIAQHMYVLFGGNAPALAVMDLWRFENGKIVEHWDIIQEIPPGKVTGVSAV